MRQYGVMTQTHLSQKERTLNYQQNHNDQDCRMAANAHSSEAQERCPYVPVVSYQLPTRHVNPNRIGVAVPG